MVDTAPSMYHWPSIDSAGKYVGAAEVAGESPHPHQGEHRGAVRQGQHPTAGLHLPAQAGGVRADGRHGLRHPVGHETRQGAVRDCAS